MAVKLIEPGGAYCVSDAQAERWAKEGAEQRAQRRLRGAEQEPTMRRVRRWGMVEELADNRRLNREQVQAALDIRAYWHAWTGAMLPRINTMLREMGEGGQPEPLVTTARAHRYREWSEAAEVTRVKGELSVLQLTLDLVLRDWSPWQMRLEYRISDTRALRVVRLALQDYARRAGWIEEREAA